MILIQNWIPAISSIHKKILWKTRILILSLNFTSPTSWTVKRQEWQHLPYFLLTSFFSVSSLNGTFFPVLLNMTFLLAFMHIQPSRFNFRSWTLIFIYVNCLQTEPFSHKTKKFQVNFRNKIAFPPLKLIVLEFHTHLAERGPEGWCMFLHMVYNISVLKD